MEQETKPWPASAVTHNVGLYGTTVYFVQSVADYNLCMDFYGMKHIKDDCLGKVQWCTNKKDGTSFFMVGVFDGASGTLVHELAHATFFILAHVGVPVKEGKPNEAFCYLLDSMYDDLMPHLYQAQMETANESDNEKPADV